MTKKEIKLCVACTALVAALLFMLLQASTLKASAELEKTTGAPDKQQMQAAPQEKTAEQVFKNIQVFKGLPASQLRPSMSFIAASLGVRCDYCHINPWENDSKQTKQTARKMIQMMRDINLENFGGRSVVNCATCHNGQPRPLSIPPIASAPLRQNITNDKNSAPLPTVEQVFDNYIKALGGRAALDHLTTRFVKAAETGTDGSTATVETYLKAPLKMVATTTPSPPAKNIYVQVFDGERGWGLVNGTRVTPLMETELAQATRDAEFYKGLSYFKGEFARISLKGREKMGGRDVYVIEGTNNEAFREELFFDAATWLLVRRYGEIKTVLGPLPFQVDYEDYREVDNIKLPFTVRWSLPGNGWTDRIVEIKHNVKIEEQKFKVAPGKQ
jgi:hypothetical protein